MPILAPLSAEDRAALDPLCELRAFEKGAAVEGDRLFQRGSVPLIHAAPDQVVEGHQVNLGAGEVKGKGTGALLWIWKATGLRSERLPQVGQALTQAGARAVQIGVRPELFGEPGA